MTNNRVKSYAERIENVLDEIELLKADIADIYQEVKSADLKPKVLRKAIANKRRKTDAQFEAEVEAYAALLLALPGATYRGVAEQTGIPKSTLQRRVPKTRNGTEHDPETGEITETALDIPPSPEPEFEVGAGTHSETGVSGCPRAAGTGTDVTSIPASAAANTSDDLAIPDFMRRTA